MKPIETRYKVLIIGIMMLCVNIATNALTGDEKPLLNERQNSKISAYFDATLEGKTAREFDINLRLKENQVEEAKADVWQLWTKAVNSLDNLLPAEPTHPKTSYWDELKQPDMVWSMGPDSLPMTYLAKGEKPADGYPLTIFLHGSADDPYQEWAAVKSWCGYFKDEPMVYIIPRSPRGGTQTRWFQPTRQQIWESIFRQAAVNPDLDANRIYIAGISEGGYGSQRLASYYADYLAGAGPIAGGEKLMNCPTANLANVAYIQQTGEKDRAWRRDWLTRLAGHQLDSLAKAHPGYYIHKVDLQPGRGHGCDYTLTTPWLSQFSRNALPRYFYWENYPMGDANGEKARYRNSFYNLEILEPSDDRTNPMVRSAYEMTVDSASNTIDLNASVVSLEETGYDDYFDMKFDLEKQVRPATSGRVRIYLNDRLVDLNRPVTVKLNGKEIYRGRPKLTLGNLVRSCALFGDPQRLFPASVEIPIK